MAGRCTEVVFAETLRRIPGLLTGTPDVTEPAVVDVMALRREVADLPFQVEPPARGTRALLVVREGIGL